MTSRPCRDGAMSDGCELPVLVPRELGLLGGVGQCITLAFKIRCCRVMSFFVVNWSRYLSVGDTYMFQPHS